MASLRGGDLYGGVLDHIEEQLNSPKMVRVGFYDSATYPDGTLVATVAFWNEYGTKVSPARPFFRRMIAAKKAGWALSFGNIVRDNNYDIENALLLMGEGIKDQLVDSIIDFVDPANAESTIDKKGFDKPLFERGIMKTSVGYELDEST